MYITLSVATSNDKYIDDMTSQRLVLSTQEDWAEVYRLRSVHDAILVGGETLRRDNPSLGIKMEGVEPMRIIVSGGGEVSTSLKIFHRGAGRIIIFSNIERPELCGLAEVIVAKRIDPALIVTELEKRGVARLFVEGGAKILNMFLESGLVDVLRVAVNPTIVVGDYIAPIFICDRWIDGLDARVENLGGMRVSTYNLGVNSCGDDEALMRRTIEVSRLSPPKESCYRVGSVIKCATGEIFDGYTLETSPTHHAEQAAMHKALLAGADLRGATIYASMEPCSTRSSEPKSCSELIIEYGIGRVVFALYEPSHFVECHGAENLRRAGVEVIHMAQFEDDVLSINSHLLG
ncbi:MAG: dihydrofolate reductase family protein [Rikenellaceae bacterium]